MDQVRSDRDLDQTVVGHKWTDEPTKLFNQGEGMASIFLELCCSDSLNLFPFKLTLDLVHDEMHLIGV